MSESYIDKNILLERCAGKAAIAKRVLDIFLKDVESVSTNIREAFKRENHTKLRELLHKLKGMAGTASAIPLAELSAELEAKAKREKIEESEIERIKELINLTTKEAESLDMN